METNKKLPSAKHYFLVKLNIDEYYENGTKPEGTILTFCKRLDEQPLSQTWKIAHWEEIHGLLMAKYLESKNRGYNCGLINAARDYLSRDENLETIAGLISTLNLSLPELSFIIKEGSESKLLIPNLSISQTFKEGKPVRHDTLDAFFKSDSCFLARVLTQRIAANRDPSLEHSEQTLRLYQWLGLYADEGPKRFRESLEFGAGGKYIEAPSPDETFRGLTLDKDEEFIPYEKMSLEEVVLKRTLQETIIGAA